MYNLTFAERARIAYANGNTELADALEQLAEWEAEIERLEDYIYQLETENNELKEAAE